MTWQITTPEGLDDLLVLCTQGDVGVRVLGEDLWIFPRASEPEGVKAFIILRDGATDAGVPFRQIYALLTQGPIEVLFAPSPGEHEEWGVEERTFTDGPFDRVFGGMSRRTVVDEMRRHEINCERMGQAPWKRPVARDVSGWRKAYWDGARVSR